LAYNAPGAFELERDLARVNQITSDYKMRVKLQVAKWLEVEPSAHHGAIMAALGEAAADVGVAVSNAGITAEMFHQLAKELDQYWRESQSSTSAACQPRGKASHDKLIAEDFDRRVKKVGALRDELRGVVASLQADAQCDLPEVLVALSELLREVGAALGIRAMSADILRRLADELDSGVDDDRLD